MNMRRKQPKGSKALPKPGLQEARIGWKPHSLAPEEREGYEVRLMERNVEQAERAADIALASRGREEAARMLKIARQWEQSLAKKRRKMASQ